MQDKMNSEDLLSAILDGRIPKENVNPYLTKIIIDLSRSKAELKKTIEEVTKERDSALEEKSFLENQQLSMKDEMDSYAKRSDELSSKVQEYESQLEEINNRRDELLAELENARLANDQLKKDINEKGNATASAGGYSVDDGREGTFVTDDGDAGGSRIFDADDAPESEIVMEPYYNTELMTSSGYDLLNMLRSAKDSVDGSGSSVQISKSWEEESEEIITHPNIENGQIVKKVRKKTEVSVKYSDGTERPLGDTRDDELRKLLERMGEMR